jgi:hypothetical protein
VPLLALARRARAAADPMEAERRAP